MKTATKERRPLKPKYTWFWGFDRCGRPQHSVVAYTKSEARAMFKQDIYLEPGDIIVRGEAVPQTRQDSSQFN